MGERAFFCPSSFFLRRRRRRRRGGRDGRSPPKKTETEEIPLVFLVPPRRKTSPQNISPLSVFGEVCLLYSSSRDCLDRGGRDSPNRYKTALAAATTAAKNHNRDMRALLLLLALSAAHAPSPASASKCSDAELRQFGEEYEQCHGRALNKIRADTVAYKKDPRATTFDGHSMICSGLRNLIEECTVILGWCYTAEEVQQTKTKQKELTQKAMNKIFPEFDVKQCALSDDEDEEATTTTPSAAEEVANEVGISPVAGGASMQTAAEAEKNAASTTTSTASSAAASLLLFLMLLLR